MSTISTALSRRQTYVAYARELVSLFECAARYPFGMWDADVRRCVPCGNPTYDTPVLLLHGFGHNRSGWFALERELRRAGFTSIHALNYTPFGYGVPALAEQLARRIDRIRAVTGAERVHVVGHSLGGIMLRWYVQELGGDASVGTAITVASPHEGTLLASVGGHQLAHELRPSSALVRRLREGARPSPVRWVAYYSNVDLFVHPARSAMLTSPELNATNLFMKDLGHLSILVSPLVARSIVDHLEASELGPPIGPRVRRAA